MINYVICFLFILILYFNLFKTPGIKEGIDPIPIYNSSGDLVDNCAPTEYKKIDKGKGAYACPTGNCFEVYGKDLFGKDGVPAPNQSKMVGKCCPYVYESKWDDLKVAYANKNTCEDCGYMYWNIDSSGDLANQSDIKNCFANSGDANDNRNDDVNDDVNDDGNDDENDDGNDKNECCTPNNQLSGASKNIIKLLIDTFLPSPEYTDITTADDLVSAHKLENQTNISAKKTNIIKQLNQLQDEMMPSDPTTKFQQQIMGKLDVISNENTIGSPWKYPQTAGGDVDTSTSRFSCVNGIGVGSSDNDKIIKRHDASLDKGPRGIDSSWKVYK